MATISGGPAPSFPQQPIEPTPPSKKPLIQPSPRLCRIVGYGLEGLSKICPGVVVKHTSLLAAETTKMTYEYAERVDAAALERGINVATEALMDLHVDLVDVTRKDLGRLQAAVLEAADLASRLTAWIPVLGTGSAIASSLTKIYKETSTQGITPGVLGQMRFAAEVVKATVKLASPLSAKLVSAVFHDLIGRPNRWLSQRFYEIHSDPESISRSLLNVRDRLFRIAARIEGEKQQELAEATGAPIISKSEEKSALLQQPSEPVLRLSPQEFLLLVPEQRAMIIALAECALKAKPTQERKQLEKELLVQKEEIDDAYEAFTEGIPISQPQAKAIDSVLKQYYSLSLEEMKVLTEQDYASMLPHAKNKIYSLVRNEAKLTDEERKFLLEPKDEKKLKRFLVEKYNQLDPAQKQKFFDLSVEELQSLNTDERNSVISLIATNLFLTKPAVEETITIVRHLESLLKADSLTKQDFKFLRECTKTYLSTAEKAAIIKLHNEQLDELEFDPQKLPEMIQQLKKHYEKAKKQAEAHPEREKQVAHLTTVMNLLATLESYQKVIGTQGVAMEPSLAVPQEAKTPQLPRKGNPINVMRLHSVISDAIHTPRRAEWLLGNIGRGAETGLTGAGEVVSWIPSGIGKVATTRTFDLIMRGGIPVTIPLLLLLAQLYPESVPAILGCTPDSIMQTAQYLYSWSIWTQTQAEKVIQGVTTTIRGVDTFINSISPYLEGLTWWSGIKGKAVIDTGMGVPQFWGNMTHTFSTTASQFSKHVLGPNSTLQQSAPTWEEFIKFVERESCILQSSPDFINQVTKYYVPFWKLQGAKVIDLAKEASYAANLAARAAANVPTYTVGTRVAQGLPSGLDAQTYTVLSAMQQVNSSLPALLPTFAEGYKAQRIIDTLAHSYWGAGTLGVTFIPSENIMNLINMLYSGLKGASAGALKLAETNEFLAAKIFGISKKELELFMKLPAGVKSVSQKVLGFLPTGKPPEPQPPPSEKPKTEKKGKDALAEDLSAISAEVSPTDASWFSSFMSNQTTARVMTGANMLSWGIDFYHNRFAIRLLSEFVTRSSRTLAPVVAPALGFTCGVTFNFLTAACKWAGRYTGAVAKEGLTAYGEWLSGPRYGIDKQRIDNFLKLEPHEQDHLIYLVTSNPKVESSTKAEIAESKGKENTRLATLVLQAYDLFTPDEILKLSPALFQGLSPDDKSDIIDFVKDRVGLTLAEELDVNVIVTKYNSLSEKEAKKLHVLTEEEFYELPESEQRDILYMVSQSDAYLEKVLGIDPTKLTTTQKIDKKKDCFFRLREMMTGKELKRVLSFFSEMKVEEFVKLTPGGLRELGDEKIPLMEKALDTYMEDFSKYQNALRVLPKDKARDLLVTLFNEGLRLDQKSVILDITVAEVRDKQKRENIAKFIVEKTPDIALSDKKLLQTPPDISRLSTDRAKRVMEGYYEFIVKKFNALPREQKQDCAEKLYIEKLGKENATSALNKEKEEVDRRLEKTQKRLAALDREMTRAAVSGGDVKKLQAEKTKLEQKQKHLEEAMSTIKVGASAMNLREVLQSGKELSLEDFKKIQSDLTELESYLAIDRAYYEISQQKPFEPAKHIAFLEGKIKELKDSEQKEIHQDLLDRFKVEEEYNKMTSLKDFNKLKFIQAKQQELKQATPEKQKYLNVLLKRFERV